MSFFPPGEKGELYTKEFAKAVECECSADILRDSWNAYPNMSDLDRMLCADVENYLPDDLLVKVDIAAMYHALEVRAPLLDHRVLEYAARLPDSMKVRGSETKYILKQAALTRLPKDVVLRPKQGFAVPLRQWLRHDLLGYARDVLLDDSTVNRGYFKRESVRRLLDDHASGLADNENRIWALLCLETWHREVADCQYSR
jgi:asparagine synthase (glutamine-hydrolysing)